MPASLSSDLVRSVLDSAPDAMILIDGAGTILFASRQVETLFGYPPDAIVGQPVETLLPERFRIRHVAHRREFAQNERLRPMGTGLDLFARRRDGTEFPVEISLSPVRDGASSFVAAAIRDVTDRRRAERELMEARAAADRASQAKGRFLATASHDLRQPLQTLGLTTGIMRRLGAGGELLGALDQQDRAIAAMSRLLNALLDISRLESGAVQPRASDFRVAGLLEELRSDFDGIARGKGLDLAIEPSNESVHSDPELVGQVLQNLVSNAIKYTQRGSVRVSVRRDAEHVRIDVADTGVGIAAGDLPHIFDEFFQAGIPANASRDGYGLGLSIVQRVVKLLGCSLAVVSHAGEGSTFSLTLPAGAARAGEPAAPGHVLLVEDDPAVRASTCLLLKVAGHRVSSAATLAEARALADRERGIGLVVTDYHLEEGHTGLEVIAAVRAARGAGVKAILLTGDLSPAVNDLSGDATLRVARKPIDSDAFLGLVSGLLAAR